MGPDECSCGTWSAPNACRIGGSWVDAHVVSEMNVNELAGKLGIPPEASTGSVPLAGDWRRRGRGVYSTVPATESHGRRAETLSTLMHVVCRCTVRRFHPIARLQGWVGLVRKDVRVVHLPSLLHNSGGGTQISARRWVSFMNYC